MAINNVIFGSSELEAFKFGGQPENATSTVNDLINARAGILLESATPDKIFNDFTSLSELWIHFVKGNGDVVNGSFGTLLNIYNGTTPLFRIQFITSVGVQPQLQYWDGATWVTVATGFAMIDNAKHTWDIHIKMDATDGILSLYLDNNLIGESFTGDTIFTSDTNIDNFDMKHYNESGAVFDRIAISEFIISTDTTIGGKLYTLNVTANGVNTDFTGDFTDIDEINVDDSDSISSTTNGHKSTFITADMPTLNANEVIAAKITTARIKNDGAAPVNAKLLTRVDGTDYESAALSGIGLGFGPFINVELVDPCTLNSWLEAAINDSESGIKVET